MRVERMSRRTELVLNIIAVIFTLLGGMTLLGFLIGLLRGPQEGFSLVLVLVSTVYGLLALAIGVLLFRRSESAKRALFLWIITLLIFIASVREMWIPMALPGYIFGAAVLAWLHRYLSRHLSPGPDGLSPNERRVPHR